MENEDIIKVDYDCWIKDTNKLFTTTRKEVAKEHEIFDEKKTYEPEIVIVGAAKAIKGLDESFIKAEIGKDYEIEVNPEEAFGSRDPKLIELHKIHRLRKMKIEPYEGLEVELEGRKGTVIRVTGSRVRIDFNNPLAGKIIKYNYMIMEKAETIEQKISSIIDMDYRRGDEFEHEINDKDITLKLPLFCKTDMEWFNVKLKIVADLRKYLEFENISFIEDYASRKSKDDVEKEDVTDGKKDKPDINVEETSEEKEVTGEKNDKPDIKVEETLEEKKIIDDQKIDEQKEGEINKEEIDKSNDDVPEENKDKST